MARGNTRGNECRLGVEIIGTVPGASDPADDGYVGLHVMYKDLT